MMRLCTGADGRRLGSGGALDRHREIAGVLARRNNDGLTEIQTRRTLPKRAQLKVSLLWNNAFAQVYLLGFIMWKLHAKRREIT
jgi:hypothetical protein